MGLISLALDGISRLRLLLRLCFNTTTVRKYFFWMNSQSLMGYRVALEDILMFIRICATCLDVLAFKCDLHSPSVSFLQEITLYRLGFLLSRQFDKRPFR